MKASPLELLQLTPNGTDLERIVLGPVSDRRAAGALRAARLLAGGALARRIYARRLHRRAGVPVRRLRPAQGLAGACGVHQPESPRRRAVRVAYEYEIHTFALIAVARRRPRRRRGSAGDEGNARRHQELLAARDDGRVRGRDHVRRDARDQEDGICVGDQSARGAGAGRRHREAPRGRRGGRACATTTCRSTARSPIRRRPISS